MKTHIDNTIKITRCGSCGIWLLNGKDISPQEFEEHKVAELESSGKYELDWCSSCANEQSQPKGYVTRDMAIDAQDLSLEGQPVW